MVKYIIFFFIILKFLLTILINELRCGVKDTCKKTSSETTTTSAKATTTTTTKATKSPTPEPEKSCWAEKLGII